MNGILSHRIDGDGEPLLLLNGGLMSIPSWDPIVSELASDYEVIRCDFRGQLLSPGEPNRSMGDHADDLARLLEEIGIDDVHVVGASFGGEVGLIFAARHPSRVRSLVVVTAADMITDEMYEDSNRLIELAEAAARGGDGGAVFRAIAENTFSDGWLATQPPDFLERRAAQVAQLPAQFFEGLVGLMHALKSLDLSEDLPRIEAPTLIVGAEMDRVFPVEHSHALASSIRGARLRLLEGCSHGAIVEAQDRFLAEVRRFHAGLEEV